MVSRCTSLSFFYGEEYNKNMSEEFMSEDDDH